ncbi:Hypothetical protein A7982_07707 [Minicystis rosea]|nr:Hypothetical protein A7982_07707 [Minicystis rosea]
MSEPNPYAPPADDADPETPKPSKTKSKKTKNNRAFRIGNYAVVPVEDPRLPKRCVVCNERVPGERIRRQLMWHPQWVYATIFIGFLVYLVIAAFMRKSATVEHALCPTHARARLNGQFVLFGGLLGGFIMVILGTTTDTGVLAALGALTMIGCAIAGAIMARTLSPAKIDNHYVFLNVGRAFLDSLPEDED